MGFESIAVNSVNKIDNQCADPWYLHKIGCHYYYMGLWCSGITFASQAKGPGFDPRQIHIFIFESSYTVS